MGQLFVSYSRKNKEIVDALVLKLEAAGMDVWVDRSDIRAGRHWRTEIVEAIDNCDAFLLMLSPDSAKSQNVLKEVTLAEGAGRRLVPILIEKAELLPDMRYLLAGVQIVDMVEGDLETVYQTLEDSLLENQKAIAARAIKEKKVDEPLQTEIVIEGVDISEFDDGQQKKLMAFLSEMTGTDQKKMKVSSITAGSVHVFIDMPEDTAYTLKTLALNNDPRFKKMKIVAIGVAGTALVTLSLSFWAVVLAFIAANTAAVVSTTAVAVVVVVVAASGPLTKMGLFQSAAPASETPTLTEMVDVPAETETLTPAFTVTDPPFNPSATKTTIPTNSATPTVSDAVADQPAVFFEKTTVCRSTFNKNGDPIDYLDVGEVAFVFGVNQAEDWFYIEVSDTNYRCWVSLATVELRGLLEGIPVWIATVTPTPTKTPTATRTPVPVTGNGIIDGFMFHDTDQSREYEYYDDVLSNVYVSIHKSSCDNPAIAYTYTDAYGEFVLDKLVAGSYCITVDFNTMPYIPIGTWDAVSPDDAPVGESPKIMMTVTSGGTVYLDVIWEQHAASN